MFQAKLIKFCSPTLAGFKTGNLFKFKNKYNICVDNILKEYNKNYSKKGVFFFKVFEKNDYALIYVYRPNYLLRDLSSPKSSEFLKLYGYKLDNLDNILAQLRYRFEILESTPHEIGLFLSYPFCDVKGFIDNQGKNYKYCGCWKVYDNEKSTLLYFDKCKQCTNLYCRLFKFGIPLDKLIVFTNTNVELA
ncbi:MAG: DUF3793 family protein [Intestinibacter sp.]|uniref:DUF3793 family protein n=1 Tax=Intestinibacter sp. TaxID=1965304 RepID=UPI002A7FF16F|nr:DUF3793 family protein [Intestinibacter sp.]MDY4575937.1 DUF3793 family protein [Intestinibacter sp.]